MKNKLTLLVASGTLMISLPSEAATYVLTADADILSSTGWSGNKPGNGDIGTIAVNGTSSNSNLSSLGTSTINQTAGIITSGSGFNVINTTWNLSGGTFNGTRYVQANNGTINISGGSIILAAHAGSQSMGVVNAGFLNISGSAILDDAGHASQALSTSATGGIDIASGWTGSWTYNGNDLATWKAHFTSGDITLGGVAIDGATFDSNFSVTGNTLTAVPEPASTAMLGLGSLALLLRRKK